MSFFQDRLDAQDDKLDKLMSAIQQLAQKESRDSKEPILLESMFCLKYDNNVTYFIG